MGVLFNINDLFAIDSSGAMEIGGGAGAATYVLMSNGAGNANSWYDVQSKFGEYLPLAGGTLTGNLSIGGTNTLGVGGNITALSGLYIYGTSYWVVSTTDAALQRVDARDDATNFSRLHWYGEKDDGTTSNFRHAYYDGSSYINVTAASGILTFTGAITTTELTANTLDLGGTTAQYVRGDGSFATYSGGGGTVTSVVAGNGLAGGTITTTGTLSTVHLPSFDTRSTNPDPEDYANLIRFDFKSNGSNGLSDGGSYNGQMTWRAYGSGSDMSGGYPIRLAYTANGNLYRQMGTSATAWGDWNKFALATGTSSQYIRADGSIATFPTIPPDPTGVYLPLAGGTMSGAIVMGSSPITNIGSISTNIYKNQAGSLLFQQGVTTGTARSLNLRTTNATSDPSSVDVSDATGITWGQRTDSNPYYIIYPNRENYNSSGNYSKLTIAWHTGVRIGANDAYGGTRFYDDSPDISGAAVILNVGVGNTDVGVVNGLTIGGSTQGRLSAGNVDRNLKYTGGSGGTDGGFTGFSNSGAHLWQLYGSGNSYGFLDGNWAGWDLEKSKNGNLYMNGNTTYYLNTSSTSIMNTGAFAGKLAVMSSAPHGSYDFYNNGTSYFNGSVTVDAAFAQSTSANSYFTGYLGIGLTNPDVYLKVNGGIQRRNKQGNTGFHSVGHYDRGEAVWELDPTMSSQEVANLFGHSVSNVYWTQVADAPGGWCLYLNGGVSVGGVYNSGFPYLPVETDSPAQADYYMECYIQNVGTGQSHYMGSNEFNENFSSLGGNPGSYGYWVMSNTNPGTSWTKVSGYIGGFSATTVGMFENGTKYWTPQALFNYGAGSGTRACRISGWKVYKVYQKKKKKIGGSINVVGGSSTSYIQHHTGSTIFNGANGYIFTQSWINLGGGAGIYSSTNGAHFYPNSTTYGVWRIDGIKNSYTGIYYSNGGAVTSGMFDGAGNGGDYNTTSGWHYYYHRGNTCLGIGNSTTSSSYSLYVTGAIYSTSDIVAYSDRRSKENIITIDNALDKVSKIRGVYYTPKEGDDKSRKVGVIAQELNEILPEAVTYAEDADQYGVDYGKITGLLIEAVKELQARVKELENK